MHQKVRYLYQFPSFISFFFFQIGFFDHEIILSRGHSINFVNHRRPTFPIILESKKFGINKLSYFIISYHFSSFQIFWKVPIILELLQPFWNPIILSSNKLVFHLFWNHYVF